MADPEKTLAPAAQLGPWFAKLAAGLQRPRSWGRGSARGAAGLSETRNGLSRGRHGKRAALPVPLSASPRLAAAQIGPGRLGPSDVKFYLGRLFFVMLCALAGYCSAPRWTARRIVVFPVSQKVPLGVFEWFLGDLAHPRRKFPRIDVVQETHQNFESNFRKIKVLFF